MSQETESRDIVIGQYTFTLATNTLRTDKARRALQRMADAYIANATFDSELDRLASLEMIDPYYYDILGCTRALNGDSQHPVLTNLLSRPAAWDAFVWEDFDDDKNRAFIEACLAAQELNPHWYPQPAIVESDDPEASATLATVIETLDPDSTSDAEAPSTAEITGTVETLLDKADEKQAGTDFLA